jgi:hypothetical protein
MKHSSILLYDPCINGIEILMWIGISLIQSNHSTFMLMVLPFKTTHGVMGSTIC